MTHRPTLSPGLRIAVDYGPLLAFFLVNTFTPGLAMARLLAATIVFMIASAIAIAVSWVKTRHISPMLWLSTILIIGFGSLTVFLGDPVWIQIKPTAVYLLFAGVLFGGLLRGKPMLKTRHISPMLWIAGALVLVFGGLTLWFHDGTFIKMKPTFVYAMFAAVLAYGLISRRPLLQLLLDSAYPGLTAEGWSKLTVNWAIFFAFMAVLNETVWRITAPNPDSDLSFWAGFKLWGAVPLTLIFALANVPMLLRHGLTLEEKQAAADQLPPE